MPTPTQPPHPKIRHSYPRFIWGYIVANVQGALEYRLSFVSQVFAMLLNDIIWLVFWLAYFGSFPLVAGWGRNDVVTLWAVVAAGYGLGTGLFGKATNLASMIARGQLDVYLSLPKPVLLHTLISQMNLTAPGDVLFGLAAYTWIVQPSLAQFGLWVFCVVTSALLFVAFIVVTQSLAFWLGNAEGLAQQCLNALINFSTYPTVIFNGIVKAALFTLIPAGFIGYVPVQLLRSFSWSMFAGLLVFTAAFVGIAVLVFYRGLRRYESGNLVMIRE